MDFKKLDEAIKELRIVLIHSLDDEDPLRIAVPSDSLLDLMDEAEAMRAELESKR